MAKKTSLTWFDVQHLFIESTVPIKDEKLRNDVLARILKNLAAVRMLVKDARLK